MVVVLHFGRWTGWRLVARVQLLNGDVEDGQRTDDIVPPGTLSKSTTSAAKRGREVNGSQQEWSFQRLDLTKSAKRRF